MSDSIRIRPADRTDVPRLFSLIAELAEYERAPDKVAGHEELLEAALFGPQPAAEAVIAELDAERVPRPHPVVGFALFYPTFSTWLCLPGLWLEDLYVSPQHRRSGVGYALLAHLARLALQRGCGRLEWAVLHWNTPALSFYEKLGAQRLDEWQTLRLDGPALQLVASGSDHDR